MNDGEAGTIELERIERRGATVILTERVFDGEKFIEGLNTTTRICAPFGTCGRDEGRRQFRAYVKAGYFDSDGPTDRDVMEATAKQLKTEDDENGNG